MQPDDSVKWSQMGKGELFEDCLPLWVADMDFPTPESVQKALMERVKQGIYGYAEEPAGYRESIVHWYGKRHGLSPEPEWILPVSGVVTGINLVLQALFQKGDGVLLQTPAYHPFYHAIQANGLVPISNPLFPSGEINWKDLEGKIEKAKAWIFCNPHNPTGRVFREEELVHVMELCEKHHVFFIADEIHSDLLFWGQKHVSALALPWASHLDYLVLSSPSKAFNLAGLSSSYCIIPNEAVRRRIWQQQIKNGPKRVNLFGLHGLLAAYESGEGWLKSTLNQLEENRRFLMEYLAKNLPEIHFQKPEGTYFLWADCSAIPFSEETAFAFFKEKAKLRFSPGEQFGEDFFGQIRINLACEPEVLKEAAHRMKTAVRQL